MSIPSALIDPKLFSIAESLRGAIHKARTIPSLEENIKGLLSNYQVLGVGRSSQQIWFRARLCENDIPYSTLSEMIYRTPPSPFFGRAHLPKSSVLYAAWNLATAWDEIGAQAGDLIQTIALRPIAKVDVPCHVIGEYRGFYASGRSVMGSKILEDEMKRLLNTVDEKDFFTWVFVDSVLSELFSYPVKRLLEHKVTAVYSNVIHGTKGGLIYPSVETSGGYNLAISASLFNSQFEVIEARVERITSCSGYGLYSSETIESSCDFDSIGNIDWKSKKQRNLRWTPQGWIDPTGWQGWRTP